MSADSHADNHGKPAETAKKEEPKNFRLLEWGRKHPFFTLALFVLGAAILMASFRWVPGTDVATSTTTKTVTTDQSNPLATSLGLGGDVSTRPPAVGNGHGAVPPAANQAPQGWNDQADLGAATEPTKVPGPTCDPGWNWDPSAQLCLRESRPSAQQSAASFVPQKCHVGDTRVVYKDLVIDGHQVHRKITQTCRLAS